MISQEEITEAFNRIDSSLSFYDIDELVTKELNETNVFYEALRSSRYCGIGVFGDDFEGDEGDGLIITEDNAKNVKEEKTRILTACINEFVKPDIKSKIAQILKENPNVTKNTLEIVHLVAPAVAQVLGGIPALAIVGTIIILIKQGFLNNIGIS